MSFANIGSIYPPNVGADPCVRPTTVRRTTAGQIIVNMKDLPSYNRHSIRLKGYDYSNAGCYFITVCTQDKISLFGDIQEGEMIENEVGRMVYYWIEKIGTKFQDVQCYDTIVMPNHIHIIIQLMNHDTNKLSSIIQWFKTMTTNAYIKGVKGNGWQPFYKRLWQRDYYEHIIRNDHEHEMIANYIKTNPQRWIEDCNYTE